MNYETEFSAMMASFALQPRCEVQNRNGSTCRRTAAYTANMEGHPLLACGHHVNARTLYAVEDKLVRL